MNIILDTECSFIELIPVSVFVKGKQNYVPVTSCLRIKNSNFLKYWVVKVSLGGSLDCDGMSKVGSMFQWPHHISVQNVQTITEGRV